MNYYRDGSDYVPGHNKPLLVRNYLPVNGWRSLHTKWTVKYECPKCGKEYKTVNGDAVHNGEVITLCPAC